MASGAALGRLKQTRAGESRRTRGFSVIELVVSCAVVMILTAIAIPSLTRSYQTYQLNSAATQLSGMLKLTRFEAIRRNTPITCQFQQNGGTWQISINSPAAPTQFVMSSTTLVASGVPSSASIASSMNAAALTTLSGANAAVTFDQRGAVVPNAGPLPYVFFIQNAADPSLGYRAVVVMASGVVHVWNSTGTSWAQVS
jgi:Tfp pilus assembly protein FimT